jgi:hypothetical protein
MSDDPVFRIVGDRIITEKQYQAETTWTPAHGKVWKSFALAAAGCCAVNGAYAT